MLVTKCGLDRIRALNPLPAVVAERGLEVRETDGQLVARCPFGEDCGLALVLESRTWLFRCVSCGEHGDVIGFVARLDGITLVEALTVLARRAGLDLAEVMRPAPRPKRRSSGAPLWALTPPRVMSGSGK